MSSYSTKSSGPYSKKSRQNNKIELQQVLVVIICISAYDDDGLKDFQGAITDRDRIAKLFNDKYNYKVLTTHKTRIKTRDIEDILMEAKREFRDERYQAIVVFYSGHGDPGNLITSDSGKYSRQLFEQYFNTGSIPSKSSAFKLLFIEGCRGGKEAVLIPESEIQAAGAKSMGPKTNYRAKIPPQIPPKYHHQEERTNILYSNNNHCKSYHVPYDAVTDDIDINTLKEIEESKEAVKYDGDECGIFFNAVYHAFKQNSEKEYMVPFDELEDDITDKAEDIASPLADDPDTDIKVGQKPSPGAAFKNRDKKRMFFIRDIPQSYRLLSKWGLSKYGKRFIQQYGYRDVRKWYDLKKDGLIKMGFSKQDANVFIENVKKYKCNICIDLMKEWKLDKYIDVFIHEYDSVEKWNNVNKQGLQKMGFKANHSQRFMDELKEYNDRQEKIVVYW